MFSPVDPKRLPRYAIVSDEAVEYYARATQQGVFDLSPSERFWQQRLQYLQQHGYLLRPRYSPDWKPSWLGTSVDPSFCEDSIVSIVGFG